MYTQNSAPTGKQSIHCNVASCRHNSNSQYCNLGGISVAFNTNCSTGQPEESMCASYEAK